MFYISDIVCKGFLSITLEIFMILVDCHPIIIISWQVFVDEVRNIM